MNEDIICKCGHISKYDVCGTLYLKCVQCGTVLVDCSVDCIEL